MEHAKNLKNAADNAQEEEWIHRSDFNWRKTKANENERDQRMDGYLPSDQEKKEKNIPQKILNLENGYGMISLGMSSRGDMTLVVGEKKKPSGSSITEDEQRVNENRAVDRGDEIEVNNLNTVRSAAVYKQRLDNKSDQAQMLARLAKMMEEEWTESIRYAMPFLSIEEDKACMRLLKESLQPDPEHAGLQERQETSRQKACLEQNIQLKEQMKRKVIGEITAAIREAKELKEEDFPWIRFIMEEKEEEEEDKNPNEDKNEN